MSIIKIKHGLESNRNTIIPENGELIYTTDNKKLFIGDNIVNGGNVLNTGNADILNSLTPSQFLRNDTSNSYACTETDVSVFDGLIRIDEENTAYTTISAHDNIVSKGN